MTRGVSNAINRLEQQFGTRLLGRTTRRVSLTDDGRHFLNGVVKHWLTLRKLRWDGA
jgi:DNA-binding transcriptional LysR family regulator